MLGLNGVVLKAEETVIPYADSSRWATGGKAQTIENDSAALLGSLESDSYQVSVPDSFTVLDDGSIVGSSDPLSSVSPDSNGIKRYKARKGDTFSSLSVQFGITLETIRWANPELKSQIKSGQELVILPVSGVLYNVKKDDTLEAVAGLYQVSQETIKQYNPDYQKIFSDGIGLIVLPYAKPLGKVPAIAVTDGNNLPDLKNYFALPAIGWNWGELHEKNAVDIANQCGTPVYAAADGLVIPDEALGDGLSGWNDGYGTFVLVEHPNGTRTRYAHLDKATARVGDFVSQGQAIGVMGNTGKAHGPTGCHLHFEVIGAKNPFALR
jgi:murein DD-endopeptidase MepM/ murein hydrolase activator NlpD